MSCQVHGVFEPRGPLRRRTTAAHGRARTPALAGRASRRLRLQADAGPDVRARAGLRRRVPHPAGAGAVFDQAEFGTYKQLLLISATLVRRRARSAWPRASTTSCPREPRPRRRRYVANALVLRSRPAGSRASWPARRSAAARWPAGSATRRWSALRAPLGVFARPDARLGAARDRHDRAEALPARRRGPTPLSTSRARPLRGPRARAARALGGCWRAPWPSPRSGCAARASGTSAGEFGDGGCAPTPRCFRAAARATPCPSRGAGLVEIAQATLPPVRRGLSLPLRATLRALLRRLPADPARRFPRRPGAATS